MIKMTYPGIVLLVGVGVGLATFLYYVFVENNHEPERQQQHGSFRNRSSEYDDLRVSSHRSEKTVLSRRSSSSSSKKWTEEGRDCGTSKDDTNNCSICQDAIIGLNVIQLRPCNHIFHKDCIKKLRNYNSTAPCPNCRKPIAYTI